MKDKMIKTRRRQRIMMGKVKLMEMKTIQRIQKEIIKRS